MRCSSDVLKKTSPLDVFGDVSEKVKHLTNDASNDVSPPALGVPTLNFGPISTKLGGTVRAIKK